LEPIEIVDGVPFVVVEGYKLGGLAERPVSYVKYCCEEADWSGTDYASVTKETQRAALKKLLESPKWKEPIKDNGQLFLELQIDSE
jgi:hypothetical protein